MKLRLSTLAAAALFAAAGSAGAVTVTYEGDLNVPAMATGSVGGFSWFLHSGDAVDYWRFTATAGAQITSKVDRLNANLDPALSIYQGETTADTSLFNSTADWGGLTYLTSLDDENPRAAGPGPFGDPFGTFTAPVTGVYTLVVGGGNSTDSGFYGYQISAVPEPSMALLMTLGIAGVAGWRRSKR